ncbi:hypothetical protein MIR68_007732 [Amoeboaphelidium protococcarum]|nr:hypothetical protein MIR68_007732 [Amoeboaphelidium protococcarum]
MGLVSIFAVLHAIIALALITLAIVLMTWTGRVPQIYTQGMPNSYDSYFLRIDSVIVVILILFPIQMLAALCGFMSSSALDSIVSENYFKQMTVNWSKKNTALMTLYTMNVLCFSLAVTYFTGASILMHQSVTVSRWDGTYLPPNNVRTISNSLWDSVSSIQISRIQDELKCCGFFWRGDRATDSAHCPTTSTPGWSNVNVTGKDGNLVNIRGCWDVVSQYMGAGKSLGNWTVYATPQNANSVYYEDYPNTTIAVTRQPGQKSFIVQQRHTSPLQNLYLILLIYGLGIINLATVGYILAAVGLFSSMGGKKKPTDQEIREDALFYSNNKQQAYLFGPQTYVAQRSVPKSHTLPPPSRSKQPTRPSFVQMNDLFYTDDGSFVNYDNELEQKTSTMVSQRGQSSTARKPVSYDRRDSLPLSRYELPNY